MGRKATQKNSAEIEFDNPLQSHVSADQEHHAFDVEKRPSPPAEHGVRGAALAAGANAFEVDAVGVSPPAADAFEVDTSSAATKQVAAQTTADRVQAVAESLVAGSLEVDTTGADAGAVAGAGAAASAAKSPPSQEWEPADLDGGYSDDHDHDSQQPFEGDEQILPWGQLAAKQAFILGDVDEAVVCWCRNACASVWLDSGVMVAILVSTVALAWENPANTMSEEARYALVALDMVLTAAFTFEMAVRVIAMGGGKFPPRWWDRVGKGVAPHISYEPHYLNDHWNKLDAFVVFTSWVNVAVEITDYILPFSMATLRALRILRVLKAFRKIRGIRQILGTIWAALPFSTNVLGFMAFLFLISGIIGVQMFRGSFKNKCELSGPTLQAYLDPDKFPFAGTADGLANFSALHKHHRIVDLQSTIHPARRGESEYPLGLGVWQTYCSTNSDCPLYDVPGQYNRTQRCVPCANPGRGFHSFDSVADAWLALFSNMVMLSWWETAARISDANVGQGSSIAWIFGAINVFMLTYVTSNMFVAVITTVFMDVRRSDDVELGRHRNTLAQKQSKIDAALLDRANSWTPPVYFVAAFGGDGPYVEQQKEPAERRGLIWHPYFDKVILMFIFLNTVVLALDHHDPDACDDPATPAIEFTFADNTLCQTPWFVSANMIANYLFNVIFTMECIAKVCAMGFKAYIMPVFNQLDFFIVVTSAFDMLGEALSADAEDGTSMAIFKMFRVFRLFRVLRVARILYKNENLKRVLITVLGSGKSIVNLIVFILFAVLLFGILGMHLTSGFYHPDNNEHLKYGDNSQSLWGRLTGNGDFSMQPDIGNSTRFGYDVKDFIRKGLIPRHNFEDFPRAFLLSFQIMTVLAA